MKIPTNNYGNVDIRNGIPDNCVLLRGRVKKLSVACDRHEIEYAEAIDGFENGRRGSWKPYFVGIIINKEDEDKVKEAITEKERRRRRQICPNCGASAWIYIGEEFPTHDCELEKKLARERQEKYEKQEEERKPIRKYIAENNITFATPASEEFFWSLDNPLDANIDWMKKMIAIVDESYELKGICYKMHRNAESMYESGFNSWYEVAQAAAKASHRHNETDYEDLLARGIDRDTARDMMS